MFIRHLRVRGGVSLTVHSEERVVKEQDNGLGNELQLYAVC